jgi:hypothetical protein
MATRPRIGSIIEIRAADGLHYAQVTHNHRDPPVWGWLIRVFAGSHSRRPESFDDIAAGPVQFSAFYQVGSAADAEVINIVGDAPVSSENSRFPVFRDGIENPETGEVSIWYLWDGAHEWRVGSLADEMLEYPFREIVTGDLLHRRIEANWTSTGHGRLGSPPVG